MTSGLGFSRILHVFLDAVDLILSGAKFYPGALARLDRKKQSYVKAHKTIAKQSWEWIGHRAGADGEKERLRILTEGIQFAQSLKQPGVVTAEDADEHQRIVMEAEEYAKNATGTNKQNIELLISRMQNFRLQN